MILADVANASEVGSLTWYPFWIGVFAVLAYFFLRAIGKDPLPRGPAPEATWRSSDAMLVVVGWTIFTILAAGAASRAGASLARAAVAARLATLPIVVIVLVVICRPRHPHGPRGWGAVAGIGMWVATLPVVVLANWGWAELLEELGRTWREQTILTALRGHWAEFFLSAVVLAPFCEEVIFRGTLYPALKRQSGKWPAILLSAVVFSAVHFDVSVALPLFILGVALAWIYERTGTLAAPIAFHVAFNGWTFIEQLRGAG